MRRIWVFLFVILALSQYSFASFEDSLQREIRILEGTPYLWGGTSLKGVDCSGAIYYLFKKAGRPIPRMTARKMRYVLCPGKLHHYKESKRFDLVWWTFTPARPFGHVGLMDGDRLHFWQAGVKSGFSRKCFCVPGGYWDKYFSGCGTVRWN